MPYSFLPVRHSAPYNWVSVHTRHTLLVPQISQAHTFFHVSRHFQFTLTHIVTVESPLCFAIFWM